MLNVSRKIYCFNCKGSSQIFYLIPIHIPKLIKIVDKTPKISTYNRLKYYRPQEQTK